MKIGIAVVGRLAQLLDLDLQIVGAEEIGVAHGGALVDAERQRAHARDPLGDLHAQQQPAGARLRSLADDDLDPVGAAQMIEIEHVARRGQLVDQRLGRRPLVLEHPALARAGHRAGPRGALAQRRLGARRQRAEAHRGDVDRDLELDRLLDQPQAIAEHRLGVALLAVALQRQPRHGGRLEDEIVERGQLLLERWRSRGSGSDPAAPWRECRRSPPASSAPSCRRRRSGPRRRDGRDRRRRQKRDEILVDAVAAVAVAAGQIISHCCASLDSKCQSAWAETIRFQARPSSLTPTPASSSRTSATSSAGGSSTRASTPSPRMVPPPRSRRSTASRRRHRRCRPGTAPCRRGP